MGIVRKMARAQQKKDALLPDEKAKVLDLQQKVKAAERTAQDAAVLASEARTTFDYEVMLLRRKYNLRIGDVIDPNTGAITRA